MYYKADCMITIDLLNSGKDMGITDEVIFRDLVKRMVQVMPFEELEKMYGFKKIDPYSEEGYKLLTNPDVPDYYRNQILYLKEQDSVLFKVSTLF